MSGRDFVHRMKRGGYGLADGCDGEDEDGDGDGDDGDCDDAAVGADDGFAGVGVAAVSDCCNGVLRGLLRGIESGDVDNGTNWDPTAPTGFCGCSAIGVMGNGTVGNAGGVVACDPVAPNDCCNGFPNGVAAVVPKDEACGVA